MGTYEKTMLKLEKMAQTNTATQMNWQERMSNTSHQREVKDLVAAGLNPVLSSGGQGAQSYTTSVDSAVNGIAGMASAREGANATRYAAQQSAAATRAAAAAQLEAARISAAASNYAADQHYKGVQYTTDHSKSGSIPGVLSNLLSDTNNGFKLSDFKGVTKNVSDIKSNPTKFVMDEDKGLKYSNLNWRGRQFLQSFLRKYGVAVTMPNQQLAFNALIVGNKSSASKLSGIISAQKKAASNAVRRFNRAGSGIW